LWVRDVQLYIRSRRPAIVIVVPSFAFIFNASDHP